MASTGSDNRSEYLSMIQKALSNGMPQDPFNQPFPLLAPDGQPAWLSTKLITTLADLRSLQATIYGIQIGLTTMLLIALLIMTKSDKRRSLVFALNFTALLLAFLRSVLLAAQTATIFFNFYSWSMGFYPQGPALHRAISVGLAGESFSFLLDCAIYTSLVTQVHIVCCTLVNPYRTIVTGTSILVAVAACVLRLVLAILNSHYRIIGINSETRAQEHLISRLASASNIVNICTIAFFTVIFNGKLLVAILARRKLNMKGFGPMQIILIMGCQTLVVPLIFSIITYYVGVGGQLESFVPTLVAVFLPLSGMWASSHVNNRSDKCHKQPMFAVGAPDARPAFKGSSNTSNTSDTLLDSDVELALSPTKKTISHIGNAPSQAQHHSFGEGIVLDRTYSIRSEQETR